MKLELSRLIFEKY